MTTRRPRTVLAVSILILGAVLALFAFALIRANSDEREDARTRFQDRAKITAALTESLFASTSTQSASDLAKDFSSAVVDRQKLEERFADGQGTAFMAILDGEGNVIDANQKADPAVVAAAAEDDSVQEVKNGAQYALSGFIEAPGRDDILQFVLPFESAAGDRMFVTGFSTTLLTSFLGAYLARIPGAGDANSYITDSSGRVIASPVRDQPPGAVVKEPGVVETLKSMPESTAGSFDSGGSERAFAASGVANSDWRIVLTQATDKLYAGITTTVEWLILLSLALAGAAAVWSLNRAMRDAGRAEAASARLEIANAELAQSNVELTRSNSELEQFASVASHDLQEPLRKVQTFGDQLERRFGESIPDEGLDYLRRMRAAAGRMSILIDDLLRFSRVTTRALPPEPVDLERIAREVLVDLEGAIEETHGRVDISSLPTIQADPLQMRQLMQNLIGNGLKFHRPGEPPRVTVKSATAPRPGTVAFSVTDNGIGIEPEYRERIFRVFERLHPRDVYAGTGIGLALCRKIVERHGGTIVAQDAPGDGTSFVVVLPLNQPGRHNGGPSTPSDSEHEPVGAYA